MMMNEIWWFDFFKNCVDFFNFIINVLCILGMFIIELNIEKFFCYFQQNFMYVVNSNIFCYGKVWEIYKNIFFKEVVNFFFFIFS